MKPPFLSQITARASLNGVFPHGDVGCGDKPFGAAIVHRVHAAGVKPNSPRRHETAQIHGREFRGM
jgi:hypothetical protein